MGAINSEKFLQIDRMLKNFSVNQVSRTYRGISRGTYSFILIFYDDSRFCCID